MDNSSLQQYNMILECNQMRLYLFGSVYSVILFKSVL